MPNKTTRPAAGGDVWDRLGSPLRALVWLVVIATLLAIYREAEPFLTHVFSVALLFVFASIIAVVLTPIADVTQRLAPFRSHRGLAVLIVYVLLAAALIGIGFLVGPPLVSQGRQIPELAARLQDQLHAWGLQVNLDALRKSVTGINLTQQLQVISGLVGSVVSGFLVVVISIYLVIQGRSVIATLRKVFPADTRMFDFVALAVGSTAESYVRGQVLMSLIIGTYTAATMALLGVHYAVVLGVAAAVLELVPLVGAVIAMMAVAAVALLQSPGLGVAAVAVGLVGHMLEAYVVGPRVTGRVTQLHPLVAMSALLVGADVGGVLGALFGVPIAAIANIALGAAYRSQQGEAPLTTHARGEIKVDTLPRLGDEIGTVEGDGTMSGPVSREETTE